VQDAFLAAFKSLGGFEGRDGRPTSISAEFIYQTA